MLSPLEVLQQHSNKTPEELASLIIDDLHLREPNTPFREVPETCIVATFLRNACPDDDCRVGFTIISTKNDDKSRSQAALPLNWYTLRNDYDKHVPYTTRFRTKPYYIYNPTNCSYIRIIPTATDEA